MRISALSPNCRRLPYRIGTIDFVWIRTLLATNRKWGGTGECFSISQRLRQSSGIFSRRATRRWGASRDAEPARRDGFGGCAAKRGTDSCAAALDEDGLRRYAHLPRRIAIVLQFCDEDALCGRVGGPCPMTRSVLILGRWPDVQSRRFERKVLRRRFGTSGLSRLGRYSLPIPAIMPLDGRESESVAPVVAQFTSLARYPRSKIVRREQPPLVLDDGSRPRSSRSLCSQRHFRSLRLWSRLTTSRRYRRTP